MLNLFLISAYDTVARCALVANLSSAEDHWPLHVGFALELQHTTCVFCVVLIFATLVLFLLFQLDPSLDQTLHQA